MISKVLAVSSIAVLLAEAQGPQCTKTCPLEKPCVSYTGKCFKKRKYRGVKSCGHWLDYCPHGQSTTDRPCGVLDCASGSCFHQNPWDGSCRKLNKKGECGVGYSKCEMNLEDTIGDCGKYNLHFVLDKSGSIGLTAFQKAKEYMIDIIDNNLNTGNSKYAAVAFNNAITPISAFGTGSITAAAIGSFSDSTSGGTNTHAGIEYAINGIDGLTNNNQDYIVLLTDGKHNTGSDPCTLQSNLDNKNIKTIIIGFDGYDASDLQCLINNGAHFINVGGHEFDSKLKDILDILHPNNCHGNTQTAVTTLNPSDPCSKCVETGCVNDINGECYLPFGWLNFVRDHQNNPTYCYSGSTYCPQA